MSVYVLNSDGSISSSISNQNEKKVKDLNFFLSKQSTDLFDDSNKIKLTDTVKVVNVSIPNQQGYIVAVETLGDFKAGTNYAANTHEIFDGSDNSNPLPGESVENNTSGIIGKSTDLYPYAFGKNMDPNNPTTEALPFYKPYNTFFDLDHNYSGRNINTERDLELFADEAEMLYGIPSILNNSESSPGDSLFLAINSLLDILVGAIIPITAISTLQGLLQFAQSGPQDPFGVLPNFSSLLGNPDKYGKFIHYIKFDISQANNIVTKFLVNALNALIEGLTSLLKTLERLMNFPATFIKSDSNVFIEVAKHTLNNTIAFCIGYIFYLMPGFKLDERIKGSVDDILGALLSTITSLVSLSKSRHHYNLLIRKIVKNNYFRNQIQFKAKTITNNDASSGINGSTYTYQDQFYYQLSDYFHRFVGERISVGHRTLGILNAVNYNKKSNLFSVQRMNELPVLKNDEFGNSLPVPIPIGSSVLGGDKPAADATPTVKNFNKSIYSLTSLVTKTSNANTYLEYHNELVKQNDAIYQKKERRLSKEHVKKIEGIINSDYMPFSIQDLRTNEVFKFHAFTENISDSFSVGWEDAGGGFGRMDSIKTYKGTSRRIGVDFWLVAMSSEDFDYMWWMVNRLIALCYPQWSTPKPANIENQKRAGITSSVISDGIKGIPFSQPFTQIPTGSPLVRLRLGDIFTSNYSKKGMARMFGFDLQKINIKDTLDVENYLNIFKTNVNDIAKYNNNYETINVAGYKVFDKDEYYKHVNNNVFFSFNKLDQENFENDSKKNFTINYKKYEHVLNDIQKLFVLYSNFYYINENIDLGDINDPDSDGDFDNDEMFVPSTQKDFYKLVYVPIEIIEDEEEKILMLLVSVKVKKSIFSNKSASIIKTELPELIKKYTKDQLLLLQYLAAPDTLGNELQNNLNLQAFLESSGLRQLDNNNPVMSRVIDKSAELVNNPVIKSFESTLGEGLAGSIQGFTINFDQNIPWELTDGSRAPMAVKIGLQLDVIHDILPGLDDKGIMRAPTYRVGNLNNEFFGKSVYDELPNNIGYTNPWEKPVTQQNTTQPSAPSTVKPNPSTTNNNEIKPLPAVFETKPSNKTTV